MLHLPRENSERPCESDYCVLLRMPHRTQSHTEAITHETINALRFTRILETYTISDATRCSLPQLHGHRVLTTDGGKWLQTFANGCGRKSNIE
jgi:hypothetical protein